MGKNKTIKMFAIVLSLMFVLTGVVGIAKMTKSKAASTQTRSQKYVDAMGQGWNLGNSFDGFDTGKSDLGGGETAWGNPVVTKELIKAVKAKGYDSIRMPFTAETRFTQDSNGNFVLDKTYLARYKEVVDWAVDEGLYVVVNIHHDSWIWLKNYDGNANDNSYYYKMYKQLWEQLADTFKDEGDQVCFETINEPDFYSDGQTKLNQINKCAYDVIRASGGNNATRMIIMPTLNTNHETEKSSALYSFITSLNDENIIATVHYYSEWVFSANLGKTGFDEVLWDETYTPRVAADQLFEILQNTFVSKGIGVVIGEWGLLGYDSGSECNQLGEELKYYEYMNYKASQNDICLMFWDNGSGINRNDSSYSWKKPLVGSMLEAGIRGERSSYATNLNTIYLKAEDVTDISIPLTLNGNTFKGITGLTEGTDYTYSNSTVTLKKSYVAKVYNAIGLGKFGTIADLEFKFSSGANWHEYLVKYSTPKFGAATGTTSADLSIPASYNGAKVRRATAYIGSNRVGPNSSWWQYLQYTGVYAADYDASTLVIYDDFFGEVSDGTINFEIEFYDGQIVTYQLVKSGSTVTGKGVLNADGSLSTSLAAPADTVVVDGGSSTTAAPTTVAPTVAPTTVAPTVAPTTVAPTVAPTTVAPTVAPTTVVPTATIAPTQTPVVSDGNVTAKFEVVNDWGGGCVAGITITNNTGKAFNDGWTFEFDFTREITSLWNGNLVSGSNGHYVVTNPAWAPTLGAGESYTFSFLAGAANGADTISNCTLK